MSRNVLDNVIIWHSVKLHLSLKIYKLIDQAQYGKKGASKNSILFSILKFTVRKRAHAEDENF